MSEAPYLPWLDRIQPYVPGKPPEHVLKQLAGKTLVRLASNENPLGPSPAALKVLASAGNEVNRYPDDQAQTLKDELSSVFSVPAKQIAVGNGSNDLIDQLVRITLAPGLGLVMSEASFPTCRISSLAAGADVTMVPQKEDRHDLVAMAEAIGEETRLVYVCNPNNPTGTMNSAEQVDQFLSRLPSHVLAVFDEAYFEYVDAPDYPNLLPRVLAEESVVLLRTFSKCYSLAALRVGYGFCPSAITERIEKVRLPFNVNGVAQKSAIASIRDPEQVSRSRDFNEAGKAAIYAGLRRLDVEYCESVTNFVMMRIPFPQGHLYNELLSRGVLVRPLAGFGLSGDHYRVTVGMEDENARFLQVLGDLLAS